MKVSFFTLEDNTPSLMASFSATRSLNHDGIRAGGGNIILNQNECYGIVGSREKDHRNNQITYNETSLNDPFPATGCKGRIKKQSILAALVFMMAILILMLVVVTAITTAAYAEIKNTNNQLQALQNKIKMKLVKESSDHDTSAAISLSSGWYRIKSQDNVTLQIYYSSMAFSCNGMTGGWRRIAYLNVSDPDAADCPEELLSRTDPSSCIRSESTPGCSQVIFVNHGLPYSHICGKINAKQSGIPDGFATYTELRPDKAAIDDNYVDGVSLTYGTDPRKHIWSFAASSVFRTIGHDCDLCDWNRPSFVDVSQHSCELNEPCTDVAVCGNLLWNGNQCTGNGTFYRQLPQPTSADIEMRVCRDEGSADEDILLTFMEIYVQ